MYRIMTNATANGERIWCKVGFFPYGTAVCIHPKSGAPYSPIKFI